MKPFNASTPEPATGLVVRAARVASAVATAEAAVASAAVTAVAVVAGTGDKPNS